MTDRVPEPSSVDTVCEPATERDGSPPAEGAGRGTSLRLRLRDETRVEHERLDASFAALADGDPDDYRMFIRMNAACLAAIEPLVENGPLARALTGLPPLVRRDGAIADLAAMGLRPIALPAFAIGRPSLAQSLGISYVIEGSSLGARMILKRLRKSGGAAVGGSFTTFFLENVGAPERFRDFLVQAETLAATAGDQDAAVAAARMTFAYFLDAVRLVRAADHDGGAN